MAFSSGTEPYVHPQPWRGFGGPPSPFRVDDLI
jgi:hypothetical protein